MLHMINDVRYKKEYNGGGAMQYSTKSQVDDLTGVYKTESRPATVNAVTVNTLHTV
jgi:hypothetical protein